MRRLDDLQHYVNPRLVHIDPNRAWIGRLHRLYRSRLAVRKIDTRLTTYRAQWAVRGVYFQKDFLLFCVLCRRNARAFVLWPDRFAVIFPATLSIPSERRLRKHPCCHLSKTIIRTVVKACALLSIIKFPRLSLHSMVRITVSTSLHC